MDKFLRIVFIIISALVGATFLYSAYTKLFPIQPFEYTMVEFVHFPWKLAAVAARFFIGLEAGLGGLILLHFFGSGKWVLKAAFALLVVFSFYLIGLWVIVGNNVNCGCFGDAIWMSPSASLIKNAVLLALVGVLLKWHRGFTFRYSNAIAILLFLNTITAPYIVYPIPPDQPTWLRKDRYKVDLSFLYAPEKQDKPNIDLTKGKHIIAFFSSSCPHCRIAAYKMHLIKQSNPAIPFYMVIGGKSELTEFWKASKAQNLPYTRLAREPFLQFTGGVFPVIIWVNDGWVEANADYNTLTQAQIEQWLKQ